MAKKTNSKSKVRSGASYEVKHPSDLIALGYLLISFAYNASRFGIGSIQDLLGMTKGKAPIVARSSQELVQSILDRSFTSTEQLITTTLGDNKGSPLADVKRHQAEEAARTAEMDNFPLFKGEKGSFTYRGVDVELTHEDIANEWRATFPLEVGKGKRARPRVEKGSEVVISGNRRTVCLVLANAIMRKAGFEQDVVTHVRRECRVYNSVRDRKDDSIFLNESGKQGKLESSKVQKLLASREIVDGGGTQSELNSVFAGNRGVVQLNYELCAGLRLVSWAPKVVVNGEEMTGREAAQAHWDYLLSPGATIPNQGRLGRMRQYRMMSEHSNGTTEEFATEGPDNRKAFGRWAQFHHGSSNIAKHKEEVRKHPEIAQALSDYFLNIRDKDWADPVSGKTQPVTSLGSSTIQAVAALCDSDDPDGKLMETHLKVVAGVDNSYELKDTVSALMARIQEGDAFKVYLRDPETGELIGEPIQQEQFDAILAELATLKARKRSRKSS